MQEHLIHLQWQNCLWWRYMNINKILIISRWTEETTSHQWSMAAYNATRYQLSPSNPITVFLLWTTIIAVNLYAQDKRKLDLFWKFGWLNKTSTCLSFLIKKSTFHKCFKELFYFCLYNLITIFLYHAPFVVHKIFPKKKSKLNWCINLEC